MKKLLLLQIRRGRLGLALIVSALILSACQSASTPKGVSNEFWQAVQQRDMEKAKNLSTWETVDYLKYFNSQKFHPERFVLGEEMLGDTQSSVMVVLYSTQPGKNGIKIPGETDLVKTKYGWRVDVKKTLGSIAQHTVDNAFDQLNGLMQKGVQELDKALSKSLNDIGKALEEGAKELKKELSQPISPNHHPKIKPFVPKAAPEPNGRQI